jgi:hypothetical protein
VPAELIILFHSSENTARLVHRTGFRYEKLLLPLTNHQANNLKTAQVEHLHQSRSLGPFSHTSILTELLAYDTDILNQGLPSSTYRRAT